MCYVYNYNNINLSKYHNKIHCIQLYITLYLNFFINIIVDSFNHNTMI